MSSSFAYCLPTSWGPRPPPKPVGLVYVAVSDDDGTDWVEKRFPGDRAGVRFYASQQALDLVRRRLM